MYVFDLLVVMVLGIWCLQSLPREGFGICGWSLNVRYLYAADEFKDNHRQMHWLHSSSWWHCQRSQTANQEYSCCVFYCLYHM